MTSYNSKSGPSWEAKTWATIVLLTVVFGFGVLIGCADQQEMPTQAVVAIIACIAVIAVTFVGLYAHEHGRKQRT